MKYRIKWLTCSLLAGLTVSICSCKRHKQAFQLLQAKQLAFPSASAIEFHQNRLYVLGDDAPYLLILSTDYNTIDSVFFWRKFDGRIPKDSKHDIESAMFKREGNHPVLYGFGSMSNEKRWGALVYHLGFSSYEIVNFFEPGTAFPSIQALNIEGSCAVGEITVFANRANLSVPVNYLVFVDGERTIATKPITLPKGKIVAGISGLYYVKEKDLLLFTASEEATSSTTADGAIGESYLGWIEKFSAKMQAKEFVPDQFTRLSEIDSAFLKQKIESVCVEKVTGKELIVHLAADNDNGSSGFFKLEISL